MSGGHISRVIAQSSEQVSFHNRRIDLLKEKIRRRNAFGAQAPSEDTRFRVRPRYPPESSDSSPGLEWNGCIRQPAGLWTYRSKVFIIV